MFSIGCILMPLANQISGPIDSNQSDTSSSSINNSSNDTVEYSGSGSLDDDVINDTCHSSRLESSVGGNSIGHIPFRVWITVCWILSMMILGR